jgi:hypothetical protein
LYSLRHYYANVMIAAGIDTYRLAQVMGTSTKMIEDFYGKALSRRTQAEIAGATNQMAVLRGALNRQNLTEQDDPMVQDDGEIPDEW